MIQHSDRLGLGELESTMFPLLRPTLRNSQRLSYLGSGRPSIETITSEDPFRLPPIKAAKSITPSIRISPEKLFGRVKMLNNQHMVRGCSRPSRLSCYAKKVSVMMQRDYNRHKQSKVGTRSKSKKQIEDQIPEMMDLSLIGQKEEEEADCSTESELLKFIAC